MIEMIVNFIDFKKRILDLHSDKSRLWVYRGQADPEWSLETAYSRFLNYALNNSNISFDLKLFNTMLAKFIRRISEVFGTDYESFTLVQKLSLGQHYGLPTPLLDWTYSPFIAVYFAVTDTHLKNNINVRFCVNALNIRNFGNDTLYVDSEKRINTKNNETLEFIDTNRFFSKRIINQMGCFTYQGFSGGLETWLEKNKENSIELRKFIIESNKRDIIQELQLMGIRGSSLFDDLTYVAKDIINEELDKLI